MKFYEKLRQAAEKNHSWLCIGLDPDLAKIPEHLGTDIDAILRFNRAIIEATSDLVCAYKPNSAFYEGFGPDGWHLLKATIGAVPEHIPVILDFKRGDIGNTASMYAKSAFEHLKADAVTVNPYMGHDSLEPFLEYDDKGVFILCLTSNPSSAQIQKKTILLEEAKEKTDGGKNSSSLYTYIASLSAEWNTNKNIGLVVGGTHADELRQVREIVGDQMPILIPGVGAQGGDPEDSIIAGSNSLGGMAIVNVARGVIYADSGKSFPAASRKAAEFVRDSIVAAIKKKN